MKALFYAVGGLLAASLSSQAALFFNDNFGNFSAGNLVGQNGWSQYDASVTGPLQVSGGQTVIPAGQTANNQDALRSFTPVAEPASGSVSLFYGMQLSITGGQTTSPSYVFAFTTSNDATTTDYKNFRLAIKDNGSGTYVLGARVNGQGGYPFVYGTVGLSYNSTHTLVVEADLVGGNNNDVVKVFIDPSSPDLSSQTPYLTSTYTTGTVGDPTVVAGFIFSQYGSASNPSAGANISKAAVGDNFSEVVAAIPEPSVFALVGLGVIGLILRRRSVR